MADQNRPPIYRRLSKSADRAAKKDGQIGGLLPSIKAAINYSNKGSHALQAQCQTELHKKKVQVITSTLEADICSGIPRATSKVDSHPARILWDESQLYY